MKRNIFTGFIMMIAVAVSAQVNLFDNDAEDHSFERTTTDRSWPPYGGEWGGSNVIGIGKFGANATSIRVPAVASPIPRTGQSYLFLRMRENEFESSLDWLWRKIKGLTSGETYTFSFWYKTPKNTETFIQYGDIKIAVVLNEIDVPMLSSPLNGVKTITKTDSVSPTDRGSVVVHKQFTYTFTVPQGFTEVYVAWVRNGNQQPYIDDMGLFVGDITSVRSPVSQNQLRIYPNPITDFINIKNLNDIGAKISNVEIIDLQGRTVKSFLNIEKQLDVADLIGGYYLLRCLVGDKTETYSFIKQ